ncbi:MAG TPA: hypothetical protein VGR25_08570 [bacterium]|nr:hypothetical protein [bacterium]
MNRMVAGVALAVVILLGVAAAAYAPYHTQQQPPAGTGAAQPASLKQQLSTATTHAGFAADGTSMAYVQQHLGHVLNCLEGTKGKNFNQSWGNVCEGQGNGILVDLRGAADGAAFRAVADAADALALGGVKGKDLNEAKIAAKGTAALLKVIGDNLK